MQIYSNKSRKCKFLSVFGLKEKGMRGRSRQYLCLKVWRTNTFVHNIILYKQNNISIKLFVKCLCTNLLAEYFSVCAVLGLSCPTQFCNLNKTRTFILPNKRGCQAEIILCSSMQFLIIQHTYIFCFLNFHPVGRSQCSGLNQFWQRSLLL